ncbi:MAG TPA: triphosphoribosyl-dephospho-CoA synthase, partial [Steroidobacteraceae bacterium]|nr:triphosphoribosyl-dephospho-CoA synthase [Steroidobacteraceae bacterium]
MNTFNIATLAVEALLQEVDVWPKPGLVSPLDRGSHSDMNAGLLRRSAICLLPYFEQLVAAGAHGVGMSVLRRIGVAAEAAMLQVTDGVNTHRGAIFSLGLLCAAAGAAHATQGHGELGTIVRHRWGEAIGTPTTRQSTHGAEVWRRYGVGGARKEAAAGFPHLYEIAWPALKQGRRLAGGDEAAARVQALFALMAALEDTNLLHRGGAPGLLFARELAVQFIEQGGVGRGDWRERALRVHRL